MVISRFDVCLVRLDPTEGREIRKTRPCVVVSPDAMNRHLDTVLVLPMSRLGKPYPFRVAVRFRRKNGLALTDQIRAVDKGRLLKRLGRLDDVTGRRILDMLARVFAP